MISNEHRFYACKEVVAISGVAPQNSAINLARLVQSRKTYLQLSR
jgi:hypothetical protein